MSSDTTIYLAALLTLTGLIAYCVLGGADFGGGVWDLLASGPRKRQQREAIAHAMGPVWEANHVWLIFVIVMLFTCFPYGYVPLTTALFVPLHLVLAGIILRGASFVFRSYGNSDPHGSIWARVFGIASIISPMLLGMSFGVLTAGDVHVAADGKVSFDFAVPWLQAYPLACGMLALTSCALLASVFLMVETDGELREDFRKRAILSGTATAAFAILTLAIAAMHAEWFFKQLTKPLVLPILIIGGLLFIGSAVSVFARFPRTARVMAVGQTIVMLLGWAVAHREFMIYPDVTLLAAAGAVETIRFLLLAVPLGMVVLLPSLFMLFKVFKSRLPGST